MTEPRAFAFSQLCAWGLTGSCAALGLAGVLGMFTPDGQFWGLDRTGWCVLFLALVMAFSIASVNNMAEAAMQAIDRPGGWRAWHWPTLIPAVFCAVGFAIAANIGVHLGWEILVASAPRHHGLPSTETVDAVFLFLSCAKPASMLAIAGRQAMDRAAAEDAKAREQARLDAIAAEQRALAHEERLAAVQAKAAAASAPEAPPARRPRQRKLKLVEAAAVGLAIAGSAGAAHADQPPTAHAEPAERPTAAPEAARGPVTDAMRAEARLLLATGLKPGPVSRQTGVPLSTCKRYAGEAQQQAAAA
jgi:hypothetical protein